MLISYKDQTGFEFTWSDFQLVKRRQRKETLREVYTDGAKYVYKRYIVSSYKILYPRPWISEAKALIRANGLPVPKYVSIYAGTNCHGKPEFILQRTFIPGHKIDPLNMLHTEEMARLLARLHQRGIITRDAAIDNFLLALDGTVCFIDFGSAKTLLYPSYYDIGSELAKFAHGTLFYNADLWQHFLRHYYMTRSVGAVSKAMEQFFYRFCKYYRLRRRGHTVAALKK
jgi:serine/threonine protein kinase